MMNQKDENARTKNAVDVDDLISRMKAEDRRNAKSLKSVYYLYLFCTIFYSALFVLNPDPELTLYDRLAGLFLMVAFVAGTLFFYREHQAMKKTDYTVPLLELLKKTENRYRFYSFKWLYMIMIVLLIAAGISISFMNPMRFPAYSIGSKLILFHCAYWSILVISGIIGYRIWKKRGYPVWKDAGILLKELED